MANGYVDLGTWAGFTPYVGAGLGTGYTDVAEQLRLRARQTLAVGCDHRRRSWNFAWALMAGVGYRRRRRT